MKINLFMLSAENDDLKTLLRSMHRGILNHYSIELLNEEVTEENLTAQQRKLKKEGFVISTIYAEKFKECDVAIQFGGAKARDAMHHVIKTDIKDKAKNIVYLETPLLGRRIVSTNWYDSYRLGLNGFLFNEGTFCDDKCPPDRWNSIKSQYAYQDFTGWKNHKAGPILLLAQLPGDSSLRHQNHGEWIVNTIQKIRCITEREVRIRLHPAMSSKGAYQLIGEMHKLFTDNVPNIHFSKNYKLQDDFDECGVCVSYTSGSSIDAILHGVPVIALDEGNFAWDICARTIGSINEPVLAPNHLVNEWLNKLAYSQWSRSEISDGTAWKHISKYIKLEENT